MNCVKQPTLYMEILTCQKTLISINQSIPMNRNTLRIGHFSAWGIIILTIIYLIGLILPLIIGHEPEWRPAITSYYRIETSDGFISDFNGAVFFLVIPLILLLFACFHDYSPRPMKIFTGISLSLIVSSTILCTLSFIGQFAIRDFNIHTSSDDYILYYTHSIFSNFIISVHVIAVTVFVGLAELFLIPVFSKTNNIEKNIRLTLFFAGIFNLLSALMFILDKEGISASCMLFSLLFLNIFIILCIKFFKRFKSQGYEG